MAKLAPLLITVGALMLPGCSVSTSSPSTLPTLTSLQPSQGPVGTSISISGTGLTGVTSVQFGFFFNDTATTESDTKVMFSAPRTSNPCGITNTPCGAG